MREFPLRRVSRAAWYAALKSQKVFRHVGRQPESRLRWDEFSNKLRAFLAFEYADLRLGIHGGRKDFKQLISAAQRDQPELAPFAVEGIGYHLTKAHLDRNGVPERFQFLEASPGITDGDLLLLHSGSGLALAEFWLRKICADGHDEKSMQEFIEICRRNSLPGYAGITFEALGLIARTLYPDLIGSIDRSLLSSEDSLAYFWHGVGRGTYFAPDNASPFRSVPWRALEMSLSGAPHQLAKQNALAGLSWALTIINIGQPEVMVNFLKHHAAGLTEEGGFIHGVQSAALIWKHVAPRDFRIRSFSQYKPEYRDLISYEIWNRFVEFPFAETCQDDPKLMLEPEQLFRYCGC